MKAPVSSADHGPAMEPAQENISNIVDEMQVAVLMTLPVSYSCATVEDR